MLAYPVEACPIKLRSSPGARVECWLFKNFRKHHGGAWRLHAGTVGRDHQEQKGVDFIPTHLGHDS